MGTITNYMIAVTAIILLLNMAGLPTASNLILSEFGFGVNAETGAATWGDVGSSNILILIGIILAVTLLGASIGFLLGARPESYIVGTLASSLLGIVIADFYSIFLIASNTGYAWISGIISLFIIPLLVGFVISLIAWWRGA